MSAAIDIGSITCLTMILAVLFKPQIKVKRFFIDTYWPIALMGALLLVVFKSITFREIAQGRRYGNKPYKNSGLVHIYDSFINIS